MTNNSSFLVKLLKVLISHSHHEIGKKARHLFLNNVLNSLQYIMHYELVLKQAINKQM